MFQYRPASNLVGSLRELSKRLRPGRLQLAPTARWLPLCLLASAVAPAFGAELYSTDGLELRWDNTVRLSAAARIGSRSGALIADANADDGDRNFGSGLVSKRFDVLSELDVTHGDFGLRVSASGWYDPAYLEGNDNNSATTFNPLSVPHDRFTHAVRDREGEGTRLLDAFVHGSFDVDDMPVSFRLGRHIQLWGESLFFAENGIAAGQAPLDAVKELAEPAAEAKEIFLPVWQASLSLSPTPGVSIDLYDQFEWRKDLLPGSGSYFSSADFLDAGGERYFLSGDRYLLRGRDLRGSSSGQYGIALQFTSADINYGFYALRFNSKEPQVYLHPDDTILSGKAGSYQLVYPEGIEIYGASASTYLGDSNIAGEVSLRRNMPLVSGPLAVPAGVDADGDRHPLYAVGDTLHAEVSSVSSFGASALWQRADLSAELAANDRLSVTENVAALEPGRDRFAAALRVTFEPQYFEVLPNLDLSLPIGLGYNVVGKSSTDDAQNARAGDMEFGISATFKTVWQANLTMTSFFGPAPRQPLADRDFLSFSVERVF